MSQSALSSAEPLPCNEANAALERMRNPQAQGYAGDVSAVEAYDYAVRYAPKAAIVDVRCQAEWQFVGVPDMRASGQPAHLISWKNYPHFEVNPAFAEQLKQAAPDADMPLFFLCRSGGRSRDAAQFASQLGYRCCFNIADGFEGDPDSDGRRGNRQGWKASGLPWSQT